MTAGPRAATTSTRNADVASILRLMSAALRNMKTYHESNPVLEKSFSMVFDALTAFVQENESLTLLVRETDLMLGHSVVYTASDKMDSLAFALYKDGIRLISFKEGLARRELWDFLSAIHEAREVDPYEADVVTILWEKDLANITYRAVDAYLEGEDKQLIEDLAGKCAGAGCQPGERGPAMAPSLDFFVKELGLLPGGRAVKAPIDKIQGGEAEYGTIVREILEEDEKDILRRCSEVCMETIRSTPRDSTFNRVVDFLGRICDWLVSSGDFLSACSILSDLRTLANRSDLPASRKASIMDTIARRSERRKIQQIEGHLEILSDSKIEEIFAYLALMSPVAVEPLCEMLAQSEVRKVRYLLCRAISILARAEPQRLCPYVQDQRWFFVRNTVMILGMMASRDAIPLLKSALPHPEPRVRREVARSVGKIRQPDGLELLGPLLADTNKMVRLAALAAIRDIGGAEAMAMIEGLINDRNFGKKAPDEKTETMKTYGSLGQEALPLLKALVSGKVKGTDEKTRACAAYGLAMIGSAEVAQLLRNLISESSGPVRYAASEALSTVESRLTLGVSDGN
jgi:hypothetical protein